MNTNTPKRYDAAYRNLFKGIIGNEIDFHNECLMSINEVKSTNNLRLFNFTYKSYIFNNKDVILEYFIKNKNSELSVDIKLFTIDGSVYRSLSFTINELFIDNPLILDFNDNSNSTFIVTFIVDENNVIEIN